MELNKIENPREWIISISGRLDTTSAPCLEDALKEMPMEIVSLILDLDGLDYISSAGLRVILYAQKRMQKVGAMKVRNVSNPVMEIFTITGFESFLTFE